MNSEDNDIGQGAFDVTRRIRLRDLSILYLKLGLIAFGGPAAHIAMMEDEVVRRRRWISHEKFADMLGASNLIPGPSSTEVAIHIGYDQAGIPGLLLAGICFILPASALVTLLAWAYLKFDNIGAAQGILYGIKPVVIAIVIQAIWRLCRTVVKSRFLAALGVAAVAANAFNINPLTVLIGSGCIAAAVRFMARRRHGVLVPALGIPIVPIATIPTTAAASVGLWPLFLVFLKIGCVVFGSGYVLMAFLRADLVERLHWLNDKQLIDSVAVGQMTPGPVFTTATFIGYVVAGPRGAAIATIAIFLPAFIFVGISAPLLPKIRRSLTAGAFLDGLNVASLALMVVVTWQLGRSALVDPITIALAVVSTILLLRFRFNTTWLIGLGAAIGLVTAR
jgi:chromate transporter